MKETVIFFHHLDDLVKRIAIPFAESLGIDYNYIYLHYSYLHSKKNIKKYKLDNINVIDVKEVGYTKIYEFVKNSKPKCIVIFQFNYIHNYIAMVIAKSLNIPIIYIQHGFFGYKSSKKSLLKKSFNKFFVKIYRYNFMIFHYIFIVFKTEINFGFKSFLNKLLYLLKLPFVFYKQSAVHLNNLFTPDIFFVYGSYEKDILIRNFGFFEKKINIVGLTEKYKPCNDFHCKSESYILYLTQPQEHFGYLNYEKKVVREIYKASNYLNLDLIIKIHPQQDIGLYKNRYSDKGIIIYNDCLVELIHNAKIVLLHQSASLSHVLIAFKKFLIINDNMNLNWKIGIFDELQSVRLNELTSKIVDSYYKKNGQHYLNYSGLIRKYFGGFSDYKSFDRIIDILKKGNFLI